LIRGASHSFIVESCVKRLNLPVIDLPFDLFVANPGNNLILASKACWNCTLLIEGRNFVVNLFCLPLTELEVILGMDWLSENHVFLNCHRKSIVFSDLEYHNPTESLFLTAKQTKTLLMEGAFGFVMLFNINGEENSKMEELPVVCEFSDVFPEDILRLLPPREVKFFIDLMPGTGPISIAPYRMSPLELSKLKKQLEELIEKGFVRPSAFLGVHQCCW